MIVSDLFFPSEDHRRELVDRVAADGLACLDDIEKRQFHGYRYAFRRVRLGDFTQKYGADPQGKWFDGVFVNQAVEFMTGGKYSVKPPRPEHRPAPSAEDIAHVETVCAEIRENMTKFAERNRATFARSADPRDLAAIQAGLGLTATETETETETEQGGTDYGQDAAQ
jgi:hypothetical protein